MLTRGNGLCIVVTSVRNKRDSKTMATIADDGNTYFICLSYGKTEGRKTTPVEIITRRCLLPEGWASYFSVGTYNDFCPNDKCQEALNFMAASVSKPRE